MLTKEQKKTARLEKELGEQALKHKAAMAQMEGERDAANNRSDSWVFLADDVLSSHDQGT